LGCLGGPEGCAIGALVDLGLALWGIFGGGGPPPTIAPGLVTPGSPLLGDGFLGDGDGGLDSGSGPPQFNIYFLTHLRLWPIPSARPHVPSAQGPTYSRVDCGTVLPNGRTVGDLVRQYRGVLLRSGDTSIRSAAYGIQPSPLSAMTGTFVGISREGGPIDFKNIFRGQGDSVKLGQAGNFAYYAIGSGILPDIELDAGAGAYAVASALRGRKPFSTLTGRMFSDASAASVRDLALGSNGCVN